MDATKIVRSQARIGVKVLRDAAAVRRVRLAVGRHVRGMRVLVLGSAPQPALPDSDDYDVLVCVNASGDVARRRLHRSADVTVMDREMTTRNKSGDKRYAAFELVRGLDLGLLVTIASNGANLNCESLDELLHGGHVDITRRQAGRALRHATSNLSLNRGVDSLTSTGFSAMALVALSDPSVIWLAGFRLFVPAGSHGTPHDYPMPKIDAESPYGQTRPDSRKHSAADATLLGSLVLSGRDVRSRELELAPLLQNWGSRGRL